MSSADQPAQTKIVIVRHGESRATVERFVGGHASCTGLTDRGRRQAEALRDRLARTGELGHVSALYTSILPRAIETGELIAAAIGGHEVISHCDLCEVHPSAETDGMSWDEFQERFGIPTRGGVYQPWSPGGESWATFVARAGRFLLDLATRHEGETVVLAVHGGVVDASFCAFGRQPLEHVFDLFTENTSLTEWRREAGEPAWRLVRYNDAAHIAGI